MIIEVDAGELPRDGHPDSIAARISTLIYDILRKNHGCTRADIDVNISREHVEATGNVRYDGEKKEVDYANILKETALDVLKNAGYNEKWLGFDPGSIEAIAAFDLQSEEIHNAQDGWRYGDSRIRWGYATRKTKSNLPISTELLANVTYSLDDAFKQKKLPIGPDGKVQLTLYADNIHKITLSVQQEPEISHGDFVLEVDEFVRRVLDGYINENTMIDINTSDSFINGGPVCDHGSSPTKQGLYYGQSFSSLGGGEYGKDFTKSEVVLGLQSHLVAEEILERYPDIEECAVILDVSIGKPRPAVLVYLDGKANMDVAKTAEKELDDLLNPRKVIEKYLDKPEIYELLAEHGLLGGALGEKYRPPFRI